MKNIKLHVIDLKKSFTMSIKNDQPKKKNNTAQLKMKLNTS